MSDTPEDTDEQEPAVRPFTHLLSELRRGGANDELSNALHDLIAAVTETRKAGRLTFTLEVSMNKGTDQLIIKDSVTSKAPKLDRPVSLFFVDPEGNPTRHDPYQLSLDVASGVRVITPGRQKKA